MFPIISAIMQSVVLLCALALSASTLCSSCAIYERGLGQHDKDIVVNKHNELRQQVAQGRVPGQPKATNMKWMRYDEALAKQAQQLTDSCTFAHQKILRW
ncbi:hypothetical protein NQ318_021515 [Aromia moschata]|uniref:SCP domain-containing protein n=1 Tax=Aromia moschata TaxID=1265417 RepID=A0AAV8ZCN1_9CUCU|nr:hypothetical protein NQ318_021515 [Aromia moschata]